jgi:hypothetical protein
MESTIIIHLLEEYGVLGGALLVIFFLLKSNNNKLDKLLQLSSKAYGLTLSLVDKSIRDAEDKNGGGR